MKKEILAPDNCYHIFNRANGSERIFKDDGNYLYFLQQFRIYLEPFVKLSSYSLLPNHFHLLLTTKSAQEINAEMKATVKYGGDKLARLQMQARDRQLPDIIAGAWVNEKILYGQFSNFFNSYAKAFNKQNNRKGSVFMKNFGRKLVRDSAYFRKLVHYIHLNPVIAGLCEKPGNWKYSSYSGIVSGKSDVTIDRFSVVSQFGDLENFVAFHGGGYPGV